MRTLLAHFLPSFVHPDPLFGMAEDDALEDFVEAFCILPNNVSRASLGEDIDRWLKAKDVRAVGFTPTGRGDHWCPGELRQYGETFEGVSGMAEKLRRDAVFLNRELIKDRDDDVIPLEEVEDLIEGTGFVEGSESGFLKTTHHQVIEPLRLERSPDEVE